MFASNTINANQQNGYIDVQHGSRLILILPPTLESSWCLIERLCTHTIDFHLSSSFDSRFLFHDVRLTKRTRFYQSRLRDSLYNLTIYDLWSRIFQKLKGVLALIEFNTWFPVNSAYQQRVLLPSPHKSHLSLHAFFILLWLKKMQSFVMKFIHCNTKFTHGFF